MLRLEKSGRNREIHVSLGHKESFVSRSFLYAFFIALSLHLIGGLVFKVQLFKLIQSEYLFPPYVVDTDITLESVQSHLVNADIQTQKYKAAYLQPPKTSSPVLPEMPLPKLISQLEYIKEEEAPEHAFISFETNPVDYFSSRGHTIEIPPVSLHLYGPIAGKEIFENSLADPELLPYFKSQKISPQDLEQKSLRYHVQIEEKTGRIFWFEPDFAIERKDRQLLAEKILKHLRFAPQKNSSFVSTGEIEILFSCLRGCS